MVSPNDGYLPMKWNEGDLEKFKKYFSSRISYLQEYIVPSDKVVVDFGAGLMHLKGFLEESVEYYPVDIVKRSEDMILCDLNKGEFPEIKADVAVLAGILEYLYDPDLFLDRVSASAKKVLVAYRVKEKDGDPKYTPKELIREFQDRGYIMTGWNHDAPPSGSMIACFEKLLPQTLMKNALCTGCGACRNKCPEEAISITEDEYGFLKPKLNENSCIKCNACISVCPTIEPDYSNDTPSDCYALWAPDEIRDVSTSGGAFTVFANEIFKREGVVFGATWKSDFSVEITETDKEKDLHKMRHSKYVQSNVGKSFSKVKKDLESGKPVLYVGCPCQIAGLKKFLGPQYPDGLYTIDILCSHVAPAKALKKYLDDTFSLKNVDTVSFRDGVRWGNYTHKVTLKDGKTIERSVKNDEYENAYFGLPRIMTNDVCRLCQFCGLPRQGDISIGDFWGISTVDKSWEDGKGTSLVIVNNERGRELLSAVRNDLKRIGEIPIDVPLNTGNRIGDKISQPHRSIEFLKMIDTMPFGKALSCVRGRKYDVGIAGMYNRNYGNNMTYYALYQFLKDEGKTVLMIDCPQDSEYRRQFKEYTFPMFIRPPYESHEVANSYSNKKAMVALNEICESFVLGSDQSVRPSAIRHHGDYGYFGWVRSDKRKIAYSTSFSSGRLVCSDFQKAEMAFYFKRFDNFSVREESGIDLAMNELGIKVEWTMDPVFLCDPKHYMKMSERGRGETPRSKYLGAYIRASREWKADVIKYVMGKTGLNEMNIVPDGHNLKVEWSLGLKRNVRTEEWLANILYSDFFVADSFHGVCFSLIFRKQFIAVFENKEDDRVGSLLKMVGLSERIVGSLDDVKANDSIFDPIDYDSVHRILNQEIGKSKDWLLSALSKDKKREIMEYDLFMNAILSDNK